MLHDFIYKRTNANTQKEIPFQNPFAQSRIKMTKDKCAEVTEVSLGNIKKSFPENLLILFSRQKKLRSNSV